MADIATKKLHENDKAIVWELKLQPGESTGVHTHKHDYLFHVLSGSTLETLDKNGKSLGVFEAEAGRTYNFTIDGAELVFPGGRVSATHEAKNIGTNEYYEILVEFKQLTSLYHPRAGLAQETARGSKDRHDPLNFQKRWHRPRCGQAAFDRNTC